MLFVAHVVVSLQFAAMNFWDIFTELLTELCHNVEIELSLQPLLGESFWHRLANVENGAHLDVASISFWEHG